MCDHQWAKRGPPPIDTTYFQYSYHVADLLAPPLTDLDILGHFDPSRLHPGIAFRLPLSRLATEKEIDDLLKKDHQSPPAMIQISLNGPKYRHLPRIPSKLVVKRKNSTLYKGRLCARGDVAPLTVTGFMRSLTAHRSSVRLVRTIETAPKWDIRAVGNSQACLQSENPRAQDRIIIAPPPTGAMPWGSKLPPIGTDLGNIPRHSRGFLLLRHPYGGRDAPMRWWVALSKRIRSPGFTQLRSDVCVCSPNTTVAAI